MYKIIKLLLIGSLISVLNADTVFAIGDKYNWKIDFLKEDLKYVELYKWNKKKKIFISICLAKNIGGDTMLFYKGDKCTMIKIKGLEFNINFKNTNDRITLLK
jgi:hypothetical protein